MEDQNNRKEQNEEEMNKFQFNFQNIIRLGLENHLTTPIRDAKHSGRESKPSIPKGFFILKEKKKHLISLEGNTCRFTSYCPKLFNHLRRIQNISEKNFLSSLCKEPLEPLSGESGKSGASFYITKDRKFVVKTLTLAEKKFLVKILKSYSHYIDRCPHTLLSRFYSLHKVTFTRSNATESSWAPLAQRKIFVIMNNVFADYLFSPKLEKFDLKGTNEDRFVDDGPEIKEEDKNKTVKKDINFEQQERYLNLSAPFRVLLTEQIRRDTEFFLSHEIMDYSLLIGIINVENENADSLRNDIEIKNLDFDVLDKTFLDDQTVFTLSNGGVIGENKIEKESKEINELYLVGIIDILQPYNMLKKAAHNYKKQIRYAFKEIELDTVRPEKYCKRFLRFMNKIIKCEEYNTLKTSSDSKNSKLTNPK